MSVLCIDFVEKTSQGFVIFLLRRVILQNSALDDLSSDMRVQPFSEFQQFLLDNLSILALERSARTVLSYRTSHLHMTIRSPSLLKTFESAVIIDISCSEIMKQVDKTRIKNHRRLENGREKKEIK